MVIFHSYVSLPEGKMTDHWTIDSGSFFSAMLQMTLMRSPLKNLYDLVIPLKTCMINIIFVCFVPYCRNEMFPTLRVFTFNRENPWLGAAQHLTLRLTTRFDVGNACKTIGAVGAPCGTRIGDQNERFVNGEPLRHFPIKMVLLWGWFWGYEGFWETTRWDNETVTLCMCVCNIWIDVKLLSFSSFRPLPF